MTDQGRPLSEIMRGESTPQGGKMSRSKTAKKTMIAEDRRNRAVEMRKEGLSYRAIADALDTTPSNIHKAIMKSLVLIREQTNEGAEEMRTLELERLDTLFERAYKAVLDGDIRAIDQAIKIMDRRARLAGLDAATRQEITGNLTTSHEWIELRTVIVKTLSGFPEAQRAVLAAIAGGNGGTEK